MGRRRVVVVAVVFVVTRGLVGWVADHPDDVYPDWSANPTISPYETWARYLQVDGQWPYRDFPFEYPPASLVVMNIPFAVHDDGYQELFILESIVFDAVALVAIARVAARRGSWWGVAFWLASVPLLGPVAYARLDMAVAAALAWALERIEAGRWTGGAVALGLGIAVKLTPAVLLPAVVVAAPRRWRFAVVAAGVAAVTVVPFVGDLPEVFDQAVGYHGDRGVHIESLWGSGALLTRVLWDADVGIVPAFGAFDIGHDLAPRLKTLANLASLGVVVDSALTAWRRTRRGDGAHIVLVVTGAMVLVTAVGRVFSPQYVVDLLAPTAVALAVTPRLLRAPAVLLLVAAALAHYVYPIGYHRYLVAEAWWVWVGFARNAALLACGLLAVRAAWRYASGDDRDPAPPPAALEPEAG